MSGPVYALVDVDAIKSGLVADMGPERWQTLCVLAAYANAEGECWPKQETVAQALGATREEAKVYYVKLPFSSIKTGSCRGGLPVVFYYVRLTYHRFQTFLHF